MGGGANVLILTVSEDINADDVRLSVAVLAGLGGADISNLAGTAVDDDVATFTNETRLHWKRGGGTGIGGVDGKVLLLIRHGAKAVPETLQQKTGEPHSVLTAALLSSKPLAAKRSGTEQGLVNRSPRAAASTKWLHSTARLFSVSGGRSLITRKFGRGALYDRFELDSVSKILWAIEWLVVKSGVYVSHHPRRLFIS